MLEIFILGLNWQMNYSIRMIEFLEASFIIPPIFVVLSYALGTAVFIGLANWARDIARGRYSGKYCWGEIWEWMRRALISLIFFSVSIQAGYWGEYQPQNPSYLAEMILLAAMCCLYIVFQIRKHDLKDSARLLCLEGVKTLVFMLLLLLIWAGSLLLFSGILLAAAKLQATIPFLNPVRDAVMAVGALWIFPFIHWYQKTHKSDVRKPEYYKFHHLLWPIIIGLFFFILPLFLEHAAGSEKLNKLLNAKPPLEQV